MLGEISFEKLQIFRLLCELQSFSMVAKKLSINQSVISRNIQDLEKTIKQRLILNNQKPISFTEQGKKLYEIIKHMYDDSNHIEENIVLQTNNFEDNQIRIYISISMVLGCILSEKIKKMLNAFPEICIDISFTNEVTMDLIHTKDIVMTKQPYNHSLVENRLVKSYPMMFGASKNYIAQKGYPKYTNLLKYHDFIYVKDYYYDEFAEKEILDQISDKYIIDNELCALQAIARDGGIGIVPGFITKEFEDIVLFELESNLKPFGLYISYSKVRENSYIDLIRDFLENEL